MFLKISCAVAALVLLVAPGLLRRTANPQKASSGSTDSGMAKYLGLRQAALLSGPTYKSGHQAGIRPDEPWAAFMDIHTPNRTATIAAFADGTASIYISNGGGFLGGSQKFSSIHDAAGNMISMARRFQPMMKKTQQYPLPEAGEVLFYVSTDNGIYMARALEAECRRRTHPLSDFYFAAQEIITQYRLNMPPAR